MLTSCGSDKGAIAPELSGSVTGKIVDVKNAPLSGVKVYLINDSYKPYTADTTATFEIDSAKYASNRAAIVDSATTDSTGLYTLSHVASGSYTLAAISSDLKQSFVPTTGSNTNPATVAVDKNISVVDFEASFLTTDLFAKKYMTVTFNNLPPSANGKYLIWLNRQVLVFIEAKCPNGRTHDDNFDLWASNGIVGISDNQNNEYDLGLVPSLLVTVDSNNTSLVAKCTYSKGYTIVFFTRRSFFKIDLGYTKVDGKAGYKSSNYFGFDIGTEPDSSEFTYNCSTGDVMRAK
jgi:hypothetical protein